MLYYFYRALRFVRLPVRFSPTEPGKSYEASLVITADPDVIITVQLQGSSSDWFNSVKSADNKLTLNLYYVYIICVRYWCI